MNVTANYETLRPHAIWRDLALARIERRRAAKPSRPGRLLLLSDDEALWRRLLSAFCEAGRRLIRRRAAAHPQTTLNRLNPEAVLVDLDLPDAAGWEAADSLLHSNEGPRLMLLTARRDQVDIRTAIESGVLVDKTAEPSALLELARVTLESPPEIHREKSLLQRVAIRWLKPYKVPEHAIPLRRFWGINE